MVHIEAEQILTLAHTTAEALPTRDEPSAEVLARAQSFIELTINPKVKEALLTLERFGMNRVDLPLTSGSREDALRGSFEHVLLRVSRPTVGYREPRITIVATRTVRLQHKDIPYSFPHIDPTTGRASDALRRWIIQQYLSTYEVEDIFNELQHVRVSLERGLSTPLSLARSHGSRVDAMFEKLYEYVVQASGVKPEVNLTDADADGNKTGVI